MVEKQRPDEKWMERESSDQLECCRRPCCHMRAPGKAGPSTCELASPDLIDSDPVDAASRASIGTLGGQRRSKESGQNTTKTYVVFHLPRSQAQFNFDLRWVRSLNQQPPGTIVPLPRRQCQWDGTSGRYHHPVMSHGTAPRLFNDIVGQYCSQQVARDLPGTRTMRSGGSLQEPEAWNHGYSALFTYCTPTKVTS